MARILIVILSNLLMFSLYAGNGSEDIHNWDDLSSTEQVKAEAVLKSTQSAGKNVLNEFKVTPNMTYYAKDNFNKGYGIEYKRKSVAVGYVPLEFTKSYQAQLQKAYKNKGANATALNKVPRLEVLLAIHFKESTFRPYKVNKYNPDNPAFGLMQLTLNSAKDMLDRLEDDGYDEFFYITKVKVGKSFEEKVVFFSDSVEKQIALTIKYLTEEKGYNRKSESSGIKKWHGGGQAAIDYAAEILGKAEVYAYMKSVGDAKDEKADEEEPEEKEEKKTEPEIFVEKYNTPEDKNVINNQLEVKGYEPLTDEEYDEAVRIAAVTLYGDGNEEDNQNIQEAPVVPSENNETPVEETVDIDRTAKNPVQFSNNGTCANYFKKEQGRTLFNHFFTIDEMISTITHANNSKKYELYYIIGKNQKKVIISLKDKEKGNNNIGTNVKDGDIIFIPAGIIVKVSKENVFKVCPKKVK